VIEGTQGNGVYLVHNEKEATELFDSCATSHTKVILQEFIKEFKGKDIRVFVVGDKVVASMLRAANEGEFRSNLHRGGVGELVELSEEEEKIALKSAKVLGLGIAGVDILRSKNGPLIIEVNSSPGLEGIEGVTRVRIAESIVDFAVEKFASQQE
jgi:ribosomal protein S6--L-glutamate ligase